MTPFWEDFVEGKDDRALILNLILFYPFSPSAGRPGTTACPPTAMLGFQTVGVRLGI